MPNQKEPGPQLVEAASVNRLGAPLPDSVLDRYFAEHPDEVDLRRRTATTKSGDLSPRARSRSRVSTTDDRLSGVRSGVHAIDMAVERWFQCMFIRAGTVQEMERIIKALAPPLEEPWERSLSIKDGACTSCLIVPDRWRVTATQTLPSAIRDLAYEAYELGATRVELFSPDMEDPDYADRKTLRRVRPPRRSHDDVASRLGCRTASEQMELASVVRVDALLERQTVSAPRRMRTAYDDWPLIEDIDVDGFRLGEITDFLDTPASAGDAFVEAPDGGRAGLSWAEGSDLTVEQLAPLDAARWGVWEVTAPLPLVTMADVRPYLEAIIPLLRPHWERWAYRWPADGTGESDPLWT